MKFFRGMGDFWQVTLLEAEPEVGGKSLTVYDDAQPSVPQEPLGPCTDGALEVWGLEMEEIDLQIMGEMLMGVYPTPQIGDGKHHWAYHIVGCSSGRSDFPCIGKMRRFSRGWNGVSNFQPRTQSWG